jgi:hypothetical protein
MVNERPARSLKNSIRELRQNMIFAAWFTTVTKTCKELQQRLPVFFPVHLTQNEWWSFT